MGVEVGKEFKADILFNGIEKSTAKCFKIINRQHAGVN